MKTVLKITTAIALCLILVFSAVSCGGTSASSANGECGTGLTWEYDSKTNVLSITGNGKMTDFASASVVPWISVKAAAKTVTISEGVENVGDYAFYGFSALESVTLPASVVSIGKSSFAFAGALKNIALPSALTTIGDRAFEGCSALSAAFVPASVTSLGNYTFAYCYSVTDAAILAPISLPAGTFTNCSSIEKLILNKAITEDMVAEGAFKNANVSFADATFTESLTATATVTVKYVNTDGEEVSESVVKADLEYGKAYSIVSPEIEDHTADKLTVSGHVYGEDVSITVTYTKDEAEVTTAPVVEDEKDTEIGPSTYIAIGVLAVVLVGIGIGAFFIFRNEKKNANSNTRTVRKNDNTKKRK